MKILKGFLLTAFLWGVLLSAASAQNWDYEKYPRQNIEFKHLDAEIHIDENGVIEGDLLYNITFRTGAVDSVILDATRMEIGGVSVNGDAREFKKEKDHLTIYLDGENEKGNSGTLRVWYRAEPNILHKSQNGIIWTSMLPKSVRHWLPVADHPRTAFTTEMIFTYPSGNILVANGRRSNTEVISVDEEVTSYLSSRPIPASSLTWAMGDFTREGNTTNLVLDLPAVETSVFERRSDPQIYLYSEKEKVDGLDLLLSSAKAFQAVQHHLNHKFPYNDLHIVVLEEAMWETKSYGSGILYVYASKGNIKEQIQNGILSQWIGAYIREEQWSAAEAVNVLRALVSEELFAFENEYQKEEAPYHVFSDHELWLWRNFITDSKNQQFRRDLSENIEHILSRQRRVLDWQDLAELIYEETGQSYFEVPAPQSPRPEEKKHVEYLIDMQWDEEENTVRLDFEAVGEGAEELVTIQVEEVSVSDTNTHEITVTGNSESVILNVSRGVENLITSVSDNEDVVLTVRKPFLFWLNQLRNQEDENLRRKAASGLAEFTDNPDLQLALTDLLRVETNPVVYAEILRTFSIVTAGASGTEQIFLDRLSGNQPPEVQKAAVEGLSFYKENERVIRQLRSTITETNEQDIRRAAIRSLYEVTDAEPFRNIAEAVITTESVLPDVPMILRLLLEKGEGETALRLSDTFLDEGFPTEIRHEVLNLVLEHDNSATAWEERLSYLLDDADPVIRYMAANGLENLPPEKQNELIALYLVEEYDERVRRNLREKETY